jgi:hypothetical protein
MEIRIRFRGGPLDGEAGYTTFLKPLRVFFVDESRTALAYVRDETTYIFDPLKSKIFTEDFDGAKASLSDPNLTMWFTPPKDPL